MGLFNSLANPLSWVSGDIAIDLGTANTLVYIKGKGVLINEPSIVAKSVHNDKIIAVGYEAKAMVGRTHREIETIRPLRDGVIADFNMTDGLLQGFIILRTVHGQRTVLAQLRAKLELRPAATQQLPKVNGLRGLLSRCL